MKRVVNKSATLFTSLVSSRLSLSLSLSLSLFLCPLDAGPPHFISSCRVAIQSWTENLQKITNPNKFNLLHNSIVLFHCYFISLSLDNKKQSSRKVSVIVPKFNFLKNILFLSMSLSKSFVNQISLIFFIIFFYYNVRTMDRIESAHYIFIIILINK